MMKGAAVSRSSVRAKLVVCLCCARVLVPIAATAQTPSDDAVLNLAQPDFTVVNLPTSLRLPRWKSAFRLTHRFTRPINCDDQQRCPDNWLEDLFGLDEGAIIGLEYRMGVAPNAQVGIQRARIDKTIDIFGEYAVTRQRAGMPFEIAARLGIEGTDNFREVYSPTIGAIVSRFIGDRASIHVEPFWAGNTSQDATGADSTFLLGLALRWRILDTVYLVGEYTPRLSGYQPGTDNGSFAIEKRAGGHVFQLNVSNTFAGTIGQLAHGAPNDHDWYLGFNLSRKFY
jgi:hypothetical protein